MVPPFGKCARRNTGALLFVNLPMLSKLTEKAIKLAASNRVGVRRAKMSAVAFSRSGEFIAGTTNKRLTYEVGKRYTAHAEAALIRKLERMRAFQRYKGIQILVVRVNSKGLVISKPCSVCAGLLAKYDVTVHYVDDAGKLVCERYCQHK